MGMMRVLFKKIEDVKGTFHVRMGIIKDKNSKDLTEAEEIKKRWQEYTEEQHKKHLNDPGYHDGVVMHLELDILKCEVKSRTLGSITRNKASGGDGISAELSKILKDAVKVQYVSKSGKLQATGLEMVSFYPKPKEGQCQEC